MSGDPQTRITVSQELLRAELLELELRLIRFFAPREELTRVEGRLDVVERNALSPEKVEKQVGELFQSYRSRGWKTWERALLLSTLVGSLLSIFSVLYVALRVFGGS